MRKKREAEQESHISFKPLLKLLIDRDISTSDLCKLAGISTTTMTEIRAHRSVTLDTLVKICLTLHCSLEDIVHIENVGEWVEDEVDSEVGDEESGGVSDECNC